MIAHAINQSVPSLEATRSPTLLRVQPEVPVEAADSMWNGRICHVAVQYKSRCCAAHGVNMFVVIIIVAWPVTGRILMHTQYLKQVIGCTRMLDSSGATENRVSVGSKIPD